MESMAKKRPRRRRSALLAALPVALAAGPLPAKLPTAAGPAKPVGTHGR
jgi:hypothetical protein